MGKFDDMFSGAKISNLDELFSKTKTVAESLNKKSAQAKNLNIWIQRQSFPNFMKNTADFSLMLTVKTRLTRANWICLLLR